MTGRVVVVGLGPGDPRMATTAALDALASCPHRFLRTRRHPSASLAEPARSFDDVYDSAPTMPAVYETIVGTLAEEADRHGEVVYAVPGSPYVAERTVDLLRGEAGIAVSVVASLSFLDLAWDRLALDPVSAGVALVDGHRFAVEAAGRGGPFLVGQCDTRGVLSEIKLAVDDGPEVIVLQRLGLPDEAVTTLPWAEIDRGPDPDHLTCLWIPRLAEPVAPGIARLEELVRTLRQRCPWDRRQTHQTLTRHLLEETYEVLDAIAHLDTLTGGEAGEAYAHLEEELGDLLFQVAFHAALAAEAGQFSLADVARGIHDKLVARHPHVFGPPGTPVPDWEEQKRSEKGRRSVMDGIPANLPALLYAHKMQSKAASAGFDWPDAAGACEKVAEELGEVERALAGGTAAEVAEELGDLLFSAVNVSRLAGLDAETTLRAAANKFRDRFSAMEDLARRRGVPLGDDLWEEVKRPAPGPA